MEDKTFSVQLLKNPLISVQVIPGHFTTGNVHISHYLDVSSLKSNVSIARDVARELALPYLSSTLVDTIVCMEKTEVIGAYLAQELLQAGASVMNSGREIRVLTPLSNINGNLVFPNSVVQWIDNQNVILIVASISSGRTLSSALECLAYYGGKIVGISALFMALNDKLEQKINALFTSQDIPDYKLSNAGQCEMCKAGLKLDAMISSEGYTKI